VRQRAASLAVFRQSCQHSRDICGREVRERSLSDVRFPIVVPDPLVGIRCWRGLVRIAPEQINDLQRSLRESAVVLRHRGPHCARAAHFPIHSVLVRERDKLLFASHVVAKASGGLGLNPLSPLLARKAIAFYKL